MRNLFSSGFMAHKHGDSTEPVVTNLNFFLDYTGKLSHITGCTIFEMSPKRHMHGIFLRDLELSSTEVENLKMVFKQLALCNPVEFQSLYYTLKEHDEKVFPIIQSVLEEVRQLFNFS